MPGYALNALALVLLFVAGGVRGEVADVPNGEAAAVLPEESLRGLVVDRTISSFGREFYSQFLDVWREQPATADIDLVIHERPDARYGSEISIEFDRRIEFRAFVSPARSQIRRLAESAALGLAQRLADTIQQRRFIDGPDLGNGEL